MVREPPWTGGEEGDAAPAAADVPRARPAGSGLRALPGAGTETARYHHEPHVGGRERLVPGRQPRGEGGGPERRRRSALGPCGNGGGVSVAGLEQVPFRHSRGGSRGAG